ncbi:MAG: hypothetical protein KGY60_03690 [Bacteroidales bacterium]|nr:hypothetical protein [Bacteroidales bacterium]
MVVEQKKTNAGQGLGIAGLVLGIISVPLAIMGCTFAIALLFGAVGIVLSAVGLSQARKSEGAKGITTAGLVVSIIGSVIAVLWFFFLGAFFHGAVHDRGSWFDKLEQLEDIGRDLEEDIEGMEQDMNDENMKDLEEKMEDLEGETEVETQEKPEDSADVEEAEKELDKLKEEKDQK